jgi:hypothetical protein
MIAMTGLAEDFLEAAQDEMVLKSGCRGCRVIIAEETEPQKERGHRPQMLQAQPSEERNSEALLGYSGRSALRREQCNKDDKALLGNDSVRQQWKCSDRCYAIAQYTHVNNGGENVCVVSEVVISRV